MLSTRRRLAALGLLIQGVQAGGEAKHAYTTQTDAITHYVDITVYNTRTDTITTCITESTTTTLHATITNTLTDWTAITNTITDWATITNTETDSTTVTNTDSTTVTGTETDSVTVTNTETDSATITNTETDSVTITNTDTKTTTVPTTTYTTQTIFSTTYDPCPKSCSVSVETVNLYFWPTDRPYTYPTTYIDPSLHYTFTSPSVYMYIPTAVGINTLSQPTGPSTSHWILPLNLHEVSTIAGNATRQLTLADLGTDCPKTADPTAIATMVDSRCDPVLAAPRQVSSWAYPCNACGRFGLFDPPYAVPALTGPLVTSTAVVVTATPVSTATAGVGTGGSVTGTVVTASSLSSLVPTTSAVATAGAVKGVRVGVVEGTMSVLVGLMGVVMVWL